MSDSSGVLSLPEDILYILIQYLPLADFLAFCASSKSFQDNHGLRFSASYWSRLTRSTFRVPNQPVVAHDGKRWMSLYRRMRTQTKIFTWGNNDGGCLGGELQIERPLPASRAGRRLLGTRPVSLPRSVHWPHKLSKRPWGIIADLQCGGWSTTALNSDGVLLTTGIIDAFGSPSRLDSPVPHTLRYPPGFTPPDERHDPFTAIKQFSAGRRHILGLSDIGRIWSWDDTNRPGMHVKFLTIDLVEKPVDHQSNVEGRVTKVIAGWDRSSAYIVGKGVVIWVPSNNAEIQGQSDQSMGDGMLVLEAWIVPLTGYRVTSSSPRNVSGPSLDEKNHVGQVTNWIILTQFVVFSTTTGRLFISKFSDYDTSTPSTICLNAERDFSQSSTKGEFILDVQGAHQHFAVFKRDGTVLTAKEEMLHGIWDAHHIGNAEPPRLPFFKIPCLQNTGVISLAFGDHHYHALHSDGAITSYGRELANCGALGLGGDGVDMVRGAALEPGNDFVRDDGVLLQECYSTGRRVVFEEEKREWLKWMANPRLQPEMDREAPEVEAALRQSSSARALVSEWFEEKLRKWEEEHPPPPDDGGGDLSAQDGQSASAAAGEDDDDDGLPAYFALSVAAAGWHSGALVLVNEAKALACKQRCLENRPLWSALLGQRSSWIWEKREESFPWRRISTAGEGASEASLSVPGMPSWLKERGWKPIEQVEL